jgi:hypothetical protein
MKNIRMSSLIRNSKQVSQSIDFTGFENNKIHPTDIDFVFEFDNEILILGEVKRDGNDLPTGQRLVVERMVDRWGDKGIALKVVHSHRDENTDIPLLDCFVESYYLDGKWTTLNTKYSLVAFINGLGRKWNNNKCKF